MARHNFDMRTVFVMFENFDPKSVLLRQKALEVKAGKKRFAEQATVKVDTSIQGSIKSGQSRYFDVVLPSPTEFRFYTTAGTAICYLSAQVQHPNSAVYDLA